MFFTSISCSAWLQESLISPNNPLVVLSSVPELATLRPHASELQLPTKKTKPKSFFHVSSHRGTHSLHLCSFPSLPHRYFLNSNNQAVDCHLGSAATHTSSIWVHNWVCCFLWVVDYNCLQEVVSCFNCRMLTCFILQCLCVQF